LILQQGSSGTTGGQGEKLTKGMRENGGDPASISAERVAQHAAQAHGAAAERVLRQKWA